MDSALDLKFKSLMDEYYQNKNDKYNPIYFYKTSKPFLFKKRNLKKTKSHLIISKDKNVNPDKEKKNFNNSISKYLFIKLKSASQKDNKKGIKLKPCRPLLFSTKNLEKNNNCRMFKKSKKLVSSDILQEKSFSKLGQGQLSIKTLVNLIDVGQNKNKKKIYFQKNLSDLELNKLHNLELTPLKEKKKFRKMTKFAMLNNLYHKYSSTLSGCANYKNNEETVIDKYYKQGNKKEFAIYNNSQVYLTYFDPKKYFNFNDIYKRSLNLPENHNTNNRIINNDNKIFIDCLLSSVDSNINAKKIFPKNIGKTVYNLQKDNSYLRIQNLDKIFTEIMKK